MYKRIALVESIIEKQDIIDELIDRYTTPPKHVINIIDVAYAKNMASKLGISEITERKKNVVILYEPETAIKFRDITDALDVLRYKYSVRTTTCLKIQVETTKKGETLLAFITKLLETALEKNST